MASLHGLDQQVLIGEHICLKASKAKLRQSEMGPALAATAAIAAEVAQANI
jgi:hypothetical protein